MSNFISVRGVPPTEIHNKKFKNKVEMCKKEAIFSICTCLSDVKLIQT